MGSSGRSGERLRNGLSETAEPPHQGVQRIGYAAARYATDAEALISSMSLRTRSATVRRFGGGRRISATIVSTSSRAGAKEEMQIQGGATWAWMRRIVNGTRN